MSRYMYVRERKNENEISRWESTKAALGMVHITHLLLLGIVCLPENVGEAPFNFGRIRIGKIRLLADKDLLCTTLAFAVKKEEDDHDERGSSQNDGDTTIDKGGRV